MGRRTSRGRLLRVLRATKVRTDEGLWTFAHPRYMKAALEKMNMQTCNPSVSPKLEKELEPEDDEALSAPEQKQYRSVVCLLLYLAKERFDIQSTTRQLCKHLDEQEHEAANEVVEVPPGDEGHGRSFPGADEL